MAEQHIASLCRKLRGLDEHGEYGGIQALMDELNAATAALAKQLEREILRIEDVFVDNVRYTSGDGSLPFAPHLVRTILFK